MIDWLYRNKEWLFSGIGIAVTAAILGWFFSTPEAPPPSPPSSVQANNGVAAGGNVEGNDITILTD